MTRLVYEVERLFGDGRGGRRVDIEEFAADMGPAAGFDNPSGLEQSVEGRAEIAEKRARSMEFAERFSQGRGGLPDR
jgi:hypothetical protein